MVTATNVCYVLLVSVEEESTQSMILHKMQLCARVFVGSTGRYIVFTAALLPDDLCEIRPSGRNTRKIQLSEMRMLNESEM